MIDSWRRVRSLNRHRGTRACRRSVARENTDRRIERIEEFLQDSLESVDARRAASNSATADLLLIGYRLAGSIKADIGDREVDLEEWDDLT